MLRFLSFTRMLSVMCLCAALPACSSNEEKETPEQKAERERIEQEQAEAKAEQAAREKILPPLEKYLSQAQSISLDELAKTTKVHSKLTEEKLERMREHLITFYGEELEEKAEDGNAEGEGETEKVEPTSASDEKDGAEASEEESAEKEEPAEEEEPPSIVEHHFLDTTGHPIDCITLTKQPTLLNEKFAEHQLVNKPKPIENPDQLSNPKRPERWAHSDIVKQDTDELGNERTCPKTSVPIRRLTLASMAAFSSLEAFFYKSEPESTKQFKRPESLAEMAGYTHYWAHAWQKVENWGGDSIHSIWQPKVEPGLYSLSQQWYTSGQGDARQAIEGGWIVAPFKYQHAHPALFIFHTFKDYQPGQGCYNIECAGFVQVSRNWIIGGRIRPISEYAKDQYVIRMQWRLVDGNWWLFLKGDGKFEAVGYYPRALFNDGLITKYADYIDYGSKVISDKNKLETGQMGSGEYAVDGLRNAAYQRSIYYFDVVARPHWAMLSPLSRTAGCYGLEVHNQVDNLWGTYIFTGGPSCPNLK